MSKKKERASNEFPYARSTKIWLIVLTALLALLIPISFSDKGAWVMGFPIVTAALIPIVLTFCWIIWQDSNQKITLTGSGVKWEKGAGKWYEVIEIPWNDVKELSDWSNVFSNTRKYKLVSSEDPEVAVRISSSIEEYRELLKVIINRLPSDKINERAKKSLGRMRLL